MSFYGNVTYYLSNAFNRVIYRNKNSMSSPSDGAAIGKDKPQNPSFEYALSPRSRNDDTILETGNKWIVFADPYATVGNNQIQIFHQTVRDNQADEQVQPFNRNALENEEDITSMAFGSVIGIPSITYDNAGHIVNSGVNKFKLPIPSGETALNQLRTRISQIEEDLTGDHYEDDAEITFSDRTQEVSYSGRVSKIERQISGWSGSPVQGASLSTVEEPNAIGTTLHQFLTDFGLRKKVGNIYIPLEDGDSYPDGSYISKINQARESSITATTTAATVKNAYNDMANFFNSKPEDAGMHPVGGFTLIT